MKKKKKYILISIIVALVALIGITLARYITEDYHGYYVTAKDFSFTSNILKEDPNTIYNMDNWSGVGAFDITFDLSSKKNNLYYTNYDVPYEIDYDCPSTVTCILSSSSGVIYANNPTHTDTVTLHVEPLGRFEEGDRLTLSVSAVSTSPYIKTLYATYNYVVTDKGVSYYIVDESNVYIKLVLTNAITYCTVETAFGDYAAGDRIDISVYKTLSETDRAKCPSVYVDLDFDPNELRIDTTDNIIENNIYDTTTLGLTLFVNSLYLKMAPVSSIAIKFYKTDPTANYGSGPSPITVSSVK